MHISLQYFSFSTTKQLFVLSFTLVQGISFCYGPAGEVDVLV